MNRPILLVGAGRMGWALLRGWLGTGLAPLAVVEPHPSPKLRKLARSGRVELYATVAEADGKWRACLVALKPQILTIEAARLRPVAQSGALMVSIAAGVSMASLRAAWGRTSKIVRAMPNTPGAIGRGISALYVPRSVKAADRMLAETLLAPLGQTLRVRHEALIDSVTAVSGSGPAYVFLLVEVLAQAGEAEGLPRDISQKLARATVSGAGALLDSDSRPASALRKDVTSLGGTTEAALKILMKKEGLEALIGRAVKAAHKRAIELGHY
ncbi:MAG: pyrroline-5-carboxylate reductase [Rhizomicrobium sp.]